MRGNAAHAGSVARARPGIEPGRGAPPRAIVTMTARESNCHGGHADKVFGCHGRRIGAVLDARRECRASRSTFMVQIWAPGTTSSSSWAAAALPLVLRHANGW